MDQELASHMPSHSVLVPRSPNPKLYHSPPCLSSTKIRKQRTKHSCLTTRILHMPTNTSQQKTPILYPILAQTFNARSAVPPMDAGPDKLSRSNGSLPIQPSGRRFRATVTIPPLFLVSVSLFLVQYTGLCLPPGSYFFLIPTHSRNKSGVHSAG